MSETPLQRECACGQQPPGGDVCERCRDTEDLLQPHGEPTLPINEPGDRFEQEADRVADLVIRSDRVPDRLLGFEGEAQRQDEGESEEIEKEAEEEELIQTKTSGEGLAKVSPQLASSIRSIRRGGQPLSSTSRTFFEPRFGHDFSRVRVHTDPTAADTARAIHARAYTTGEHIVFASGAYAPDSFAGRRLLAHELSHVIQQGHAGEKLSQAPQRLIQRDDVPELKKGIGESLRKIGGKAIEEAKKTILAEVKEIESNWKDIRDPAASFNEVKDWLNDGDTVIGLIRDHTTLALDALTKGDSALVRFMTQIVEADMVTYRYIAWHVAVYVNLLTLEPQLKRLKDAFAGDKRAFTGRAVAEETVTLLTKLAAGYRKQSPEWGKIVKVIPAEVTRSSGGKITLTVTIAAHSDPAIKELFNSMTEQFTKDQVAVETLVIEMNRFLDNATKEGVLQALEAVQEFYTVRGGKRGGPKAKRKGKQKKKEDKKQEKKEEKKEESKKSEEEKGGKKRGRWGCTDVRCNVHPDPQADPPNPNCPPRVIGNTAYIYPSYNEACLAAQRDANSKVPRGCTKRHCNCRTKCSKR